MVKKKILESLKEAILELDDDKVFRLLEDGLKAGLSPLELITEGLSPSLTAIGEGFQTGERFMVDMVVAGEIMNDAMERLRPAMEGSGKPVGDVMVIGTIQGDLHNIGKRVVSAIFVGGGYRVIDIGEDQPASAFVDAVRKYKPKVVGASAILGAVRDNCGVINKALVEAGLRDDVIYILGGWEMTQAASVKFGADCYGENALDALRKVKMIRAGEMPGWRDRAKAK